MKLISLNTWGGRLFEPLLAFIKDCAADTDVFCLQEVLDIPGEAIIGSATNISLFSVIANALPNFTGFFAAAQDNYEPITNGSSGASIGLATFVRKTHAIHAKGDFFINNERNSFVRTDYTTMPNNLSYIQLNTGGRLLTICNVYGASWPGSKLDTPQRLLQSQKILDFVLSQPGEKIIAGDLNLLPGTKSINMFEKNGFRNLIKDFNIFTTRGSMHKKLKPELGLGENGWQEFADYTFVSFGIKSVQFTVPDIPISDHLPMILEFKI
jgi:exonuclease III